MTVNGPTPELMTALVCTADRKDSVVRTVSSILSNTYPCFEVIVVDQSDHNDTFDALRPLLTDDRVRYIRSPVKGKGIALNLGLSQARSRIVACTDDDCEVPAGWLEQLKAIFDRDPGTAIVFGAVEAGPHDSTLGFVPAFRPQGEVIARSIFDSSRAHGMGACMGFRRSVVEQLGGFDPAFGPGGRFMSGDDSDITTRALLNGHIVRESNAVRVTHYGFRTWRQGRTLAFRDWYARGATYAKPLRAGDWRVLYVASVVLFQRGVWPLIRAAGHGRRPVGFTGVVAFLRGFARGLLTPVRAEPLLFDPPD